LSTRASEFTRNLKAMMSIAVAAEELDAATLQALEDTKMDKQHDALNDLMD
jgi:hypothetical protein